MLIWGKKIFQIAEAPAKCSAAGATEALKMSAECKYSDLLLYTVIFHSFVLMQVFNEINSRKLGSKEFNVFDKFFNNYLFQVVIIITIIIQVVLVEANLTALRTTSLPW